MKYSSIITVNGGFFFPDLAPAESFEERLEQLSAVGINQIEIWGEKLHQDMARVKSGLKNSPLTVSTICAGFRGSLLHADTQMRKFAFDDLKLLLSLAGELNAVGVVMTPYQSYMPIIGGLEPYRSARELQNSMLEDLLGRLGEEALRHQTKLLLEPVNRYESPLFNRVEQMVQLCDLIGSAGLGIIADTFHMNIEEQDIATVLRKYCSQITHIHCVDSNRFLPGQGHTDFAPIIAALREKGYSGALSFECFVKGEDHLGTLRKTVEYLKNLE